METISKSTNHWDLDRGNEPYFDYEYSCVEKFSTSILFRNLSDTFGLDPYVIIEIAKGFATHLCVPKSEFEVYVEPVKQSIVVPKVIKQGEPVSCVTMEEYVEPPPYPNQVKENLLIVVTNKSNRKMFSAL